jgi:hypothetical protein
MLVFTDCLGCAIGDYTPTVNEAGEEDESVVNDLYSSILRAPARMPGVSSIEEGSADEIPGVDLPDVAVVNKPTEWIWVALKLSPLKMLCLMMLSLIRH